MSCRFLTISFKYFPGTIALKFSLASLTTAFLNANLNTSTETTFNLLSLTSNN